MKNNLDHTDQIHNDMLVQISVLPSLRAPCQVNGDLAAWHNVTDVFHLPLSGGRGNQREQEVGSNGKTETTMPGKEFTTVPFNML